MCETGVCRPPLVYGNSRIASADSPSRLPKKINFFQIDNFISAAAQDRFEREQTKARGLRSPDKCVLTREGIGIRLEIDECCFASVREPVLAANVKMHDSERILRRL